MSHYKNYKKYVHPLKKYYLTTLAAIGLAWLILMRRLL